MNIYDFFRKSKRIIYRYTNEIVIKKCFGRCGKNVSVPNTCSFSGIKNIYIGNNVSLGDRNIIQTTRAKVIFGDSIMIGPGVTIISGDHRTDMIGRTMISIQEQEKLEENDQDIIFEGDNWIGANSTILKGVVIGKGAIVAAGSVVTKKVEAYSIYGGVPATKIKNRFSEDDLQKHIELLYGERLEKA